MKRIFATVLALIMIILVFPANMVYADDYLKHIEGFSADFSGDEPEVGSMGLSGSSYETIDEKQREIESLEKQKERNEKTIEEKEERII